MVCRARAGLRRSVLLSPNAEFLLFEGAEGALSRHPNQMFFFCTSDGFRPQTSGWYVDAKTLGLSGAAYKLDACSIQGAVAVVDERCLDGKESRRIWATFLRVEKKQNVAFQNVGRTFARKPTFLPEIKSWATFCGTFSPIKSCRTKCCPKINILVKDYASINVGVRSVHLRYFLNRPHPPHQK